MTARVSPDRVSPKSPLLIQLSGLVQAAVVSRPNRFVAEVRLLNGPPVHGEAATPSRVPSCRGSGRKTVLAHVADSGRLRELIFPGNLVMVRRAAEAAGAGVSRVGRNGSSRAPSAARPPQRKTSYDLVLASAQATSFEEPANWSASIQPATEPIWVSVDTRYPNLLLGQALRAGALKDIPGARDVASEYWYHRLSPWKEEHEGEGANLGVSRVATRPVRSRMDFYLEGGSRETSCLIEVKSVTLCREGAGYFPDAPTARGVRHLHELTRAVKEGYRAFVVFIAQREDVGLVRPNREMDPAFADALKKAGDSGVQLLGYRCLVTPTKIVLDPSPVPVDPR